MFGPLETVGRSVLYYGAHPNTRRFLRVLAAYGIIQVLAQDLGVRSGEAQAKLVRSEPLLSILMFASAFAVTDDFLLAFIATFFYYFLKYYVSGGITAPVCFRKV